jgi:nitrile hydratase subunit beta
VNGVHDMGGMQGMGRVPYEKDEPVFHETWEARVYALTRALRAFRLWTLDHSRHSIEQLPQHEYLRMSYYERWFASSAVALPLEHAMFTEEELRTGRAAPGSPRATPALDAARASSLPSRGIRSAADAAVKPRFRVGQRVHTLNMNPPGHTRLPRYARDKQGIVVLDHGVYDFPDTVAHDLGEKRQHVYAVRFAARELWGESASARDSVHLDLFEDYLERA